tara:strand:- start:44 stop:307 length:264 start_codon:yes stop_codon:yes gene_type:complete
MAYIKRPFPRKGVDWNRINKKKEKEMTDKTRQELNEVYDRMNSLSKQFMQMIGQMTELEQALYNLNGKINIHIKEGHKPNEQIGANT